VSEPGALRSADFPRGTKRLSEKTRRGLVGMNVCAESSAKSPSVQYSRLLSDRVIGSTEFCDARSAQKVLCRSVFEPTKSKAFSMMRADENMNISLLRSSLHVWRRDPDWEQHVSSEKDAHWTRLSLCRFHQCALRIATNGALSGLVLISMRAYVINDAIGSTLGRLKKIPGYNICRRDRPRWRVGFRLWAGAANSARSTRSAVSGSSIIIVVISEERRILAHGRGPL
jgi:hypothetical protein